MLNPVKAQNLAAYHDNQGRFYIFDSGKTIQAEYLPVTDFKVGGKCILYTDSRNRLKMYYKGDITTLSVNAPTDFTALDNLAVYNIGGIVRILDDGRDFTVSTHSILYYAEDSLVTFYDDAQRLLAVYYNRRVEMLEDGLVSGILANHFMAGDNLVAYISGRTKEFKVYYQGQTRVIESFNSGGTFKTGRDIVAYVNNADQKFRIFYKGEIYDVEEFPPMGFVAGDGIVAYVDYSGYFKIFCDGEVTTISTINPDFFKVVNRMVIYGERGYFNVWDDYRTYTLETYIPREKDWAANWGTILYIDLNRNVKIYNKGENKVLTYDLADSVYLYRDVIVVNKGMNNHNVYWKGKKY
jgi:hypothetical protein